MAVVTLAAAIDHLQLPIDLSVTPADPRVPDITKKLAAAEGTVVQYLGARWDAMWIDEASTPELIQAAILIQLGELFAFRGDTTSGEGPEQTEGWLSPIATNLLRRYRDPVLA